jgi:hypothetical protein
MISNELKHNSEPREELMRLHGPKYRPDQPQVRVANWWEHDNKAVKLDDEQVWLVDGRRLSLLQEGTKGKYVGQRLTLSTCSSCTSIAFHPRISLMIRQDIIFYSRSEGIQTLAPTSLIKAG